MQLAEFVYYSTVPSLHPIIFSIYILLSPKENTVWTWQMEHVLFLYWTIMTPLLLPPTTNY